MKLLGSLLAPRARTSLLATLLESLGRRVQFGTLTMHTPDGQVYEFVGANAQQEHAEWHIHSWKTLVAVATRGAIGLGESYLSGHWTSPDLVSFMQFACRNEYALGDGVAGIALLRLSDRWRHWMRQNTASGARRNIASHYDLGNAFYQLWLDPSMTYSSALYADGDETLEQAQQKKYARLADLAQIEPGADVLEIGCGWGGFMEYVAAQRAASVTGVSISKSQCEFAAARTQAAGLATNAQVELQDYRDLTGTYKHIVSIEMFEAVGEAYWDTYAAKLKALLAPGGHAALQLIIIESARFEGYRRSPDFIQRYVFPGGMLPSYNALADCLGKQGLKITDRLDFGQDYARTLAAWRQRFDANWAAISEQGFDQHFRRLWHFYLAYCEAGFRENAVDVVQVRVEHAP